MRGIKIKEKTVDNISQQWPGSFRIFGASKKAVTTNFKSLILLVLITAAVYIPLAALLPSGPLNDLLTSLVAYTATIPFTVLLLAGSRGAKISASESLKAITPKLTLRVIGLNLLVTLILVLSILLFFVPFLFIYPRLLLVNYYLIDKNLGVFDALDASWNGSKGHAGKLWGVTIAALTFGVLILVLVGIYLSVVYIASTALLYLFITNQKSVLSEQAII